VTPASRVLEGIVDTDHEKRRCSALFRLFLRFFLGTFQRHRLLKRLAHFIQTFFIEVMHAFGAFGAQVDQLVVLAHNEMGSLSVGIGNALIMRRTSSPDQKKHSNLNINPQPLAWRAINQRRYRHGVVFI